MKRVVFAAIVLVFGTLFFSQPANALGLKIAPLEYKTTLKEKERQRGFIDISNPSSQAISVAVSVQAFRQIDDNGGLQFYDDKQISTGIKPELASLELGPREAIRLFFYVDSGLLPEGDVYAAIFFTTQPKQPRSGVGQLVRVGTILSIINGNPGPRAALIKGLNLPPLQLSETINGTYTIKNTGDAKTGFYPKVKITSWPSGSTKQIESSLLFGGRQRSNDISLKTGIGIHKIELSYGDSKKSQWVITLTPWILIAVFMVLLIISVELLLLKKRRKASHKRTA